MRAASLYGAWRVVNPAFKGLHINDRSQQSVVKIGYIKTRRLSSTTLSYIYCRVLRQNHSFPLAVSSLAVELVIRPIDRENGPCTLKTWKKKTGLENQDGHFEDLHLSHQQPLRRAPFWLDIPVAPSCLLSSRFTLLSNALWVELHCYVANYSIFKIRYFWRISTTVMPWTIQSNTVAVNHEIHEEVSNVESCFFFPIVCQAFS